MSDDSHSCPSCGARLSASAEQCPLCGTEVSPPSESLEEGEGEQTEADPGTAAGDEDAPSVYCNQCGWENPPGARYCSKCGSELQDLSAAPEGTRPVTAELPSGSQEASSESPSPETDEADEQSAMGRQIAVVVGGAVLVVVGLFFVTQWSASQDWGGDSASEPATEAPGPAQSGPEGSASGPGVAQGERPMARSGPEAADLQQLVDQTAAPLSGSLAEQVDSLRTRIDQASETEKEQLRVELVNLLIGAGRPGRAAVLQQEVADATGTVEARRRAADLLYRWMQKLQQDGQGTRISQVAQHAAEAYASVVDARPDDLDARTRMGEAYLLTNEPMKGIETINAVLEDDSTFVPARFQKGLALLQISRFDQAAQQFEKVMRDAEDGSPFYRQAERALQVIRKRRKTSAEDGSTVGMGQ